MGVAPDSALFGEHVTTSAFAQIKQLADANHLESLSIGMSGDYETALRNGATHLRLGSALFGQRGS
jgi:PLP dependent protein